MASQEVQYLRCAASLGISRAPMYAAFLGICDALILNFFLCHPKTDFLRVHQKNFINSNLKETSLHNRWYLKSLKTTGVFLQIVCQELKATIPTPRTKRPHVRQAPRDIGFFKRRDPLRNFLAVLIFFLFFETNHCINLVFAFYLLYRIVYTFIQFYTLHAPHYLPRHLPDFGRAFQI